MPGNREKARKRSTAWSRISSEKTTVMPGRLTPKGDRAAAMA